MAKKNLFVVIYGIDGVGKTTVIGELEKKFNKTEYDFLNFDNFKKNELDNPYYLSKNDVIENCSDTSQFFHYLGSNIFQGNIISKLLKSGKLVIKSRWFLDIFADFSYRGLDFIENLKTKFPFLIPDVSILLTVDEKERLLRIKNRKKNTSNDLDEKRMNFLKNYLEKSFENKLYNDKNFLKIDTTNIKPEQVADIIFNFCSKINERYSF